MSIKYEFFAIASRITEFKDEPSADKQKITRLHSYVYCAFLSTKMEYISYIFLTIIQWKTFTALIKLNLLISGQTSLITMSLFSHSC